MTESLLIYLLFLLTVSRLICFLRPSLLRKLDEMTQAKLKEGTDSVVWAGVVALLLIHFVVRSFYIPSGSMLPTLKVNDFILVNELLYEFTDPVRGDIIVFHPTEAYKGGKSDLVKRVVAVENDKVEVKDGHLYVNDVQIQEKFILEPIAGNSPVQIVKKAHVFVMGDNRNNSRDSRSIGQIPTQNIVGRTELIFFPPNRIQFFNIPR